MDTLIVNITAHPIHQSLVHLAGFLVPPKAVKIAMLNDVMKDLQSLDTMEALFAVGKGHIQQTCEGYHHTLVHPGNTGHLGHSIYFTFR